MGATGIVNKKNVASGYRMGGGLWCERAAESQLLRNEKKPEGECLRAVGF